ncbi:hypothetical protein [Bradyrhizobium sp. NP1]|uniref:hypothetical protein n=1 Tax=Bradyrhizobium sp. NP1 TaxID=3049772 RepID=UPI0025A5F011|nr:hypothetical protein [Bradyrhizobium sp. NP1]WJR76490.1 hypothetical protein QOU61_27555 [Bradyrhizobium sp. NP1]
MDPLITWILDRIADLIAWLIPGKFGKGLAFLVALILFIAIIYLMYGETIQNFFDDYFTWRISWVQHKQ